MRYLLLTFVTFSVLLLLAGCQENFMTDPNQHNGLQKTDDPSVTTGTILLEGMFQDPHPVINSYYFINGEIQYRHEVQFLDPIPPSLQYLISLDLSVSANFTYFCTVCEPQTDNATVGIISTSLNDNFYISKDGIYVMEKAFEIIGRNDGMILKCRFLVTTDGIGLNEMWLELIDDNQNQTN